MIPLPENQNKNWPANNLDIWSKRYQDEGALWGEAPSECAQILLTKLKKPHARILEFAFGYGRDTKALLDQGHFVEAVDKSDVGVILAQERIENYIRTDRAKIIHGDFLEAQIQNDYFDAAISHRTLHLIDQVKAPEVIKRIATSLKPGGVLVLSARSPRDFNKQQMKWVNANGANDNTTAIYKHRENHVINFYDENRLTTLLKDYFTNLSFLNGEEMESCANIDVNGKHIMSQYVMVIAQKKH